MAWQKYELVFRLQSPLHIGYRKVGNLMQTRGYVPGKNLWAALTARLTRDYDNGAEGQRYVDIGQEVNQSFRFGYLYPALSKDPLREVQSVDDLAIHYPWEDKLFDYRFLSSYASTALNHDRQAAEEGLLHEAEFVRPWARPLPGDDQPPPVYLAGCLYAQDKLGEKLTGWPLALARVQLGGEQGYGWGRLGLVLCNKQDEPFTTEPRVGTHDGHITAHLKAENAANVQGPIEPLVGWERDNDKKSRTRWRLTPEVKVCYAPGAVVTGENTFVIGHYGIWE